MKNVPGVHVKKIFKKFQKIFFKSETYFKIFSFPPHFYQIKKNTKGGGSV